MKTILEYINESLETKSVWAKTRNSIVLQDKLSNFFKSQKSKISLANKQELGKCFKAFVATLTFGSNMDNHKVLKEFGLATEQGFKNFIYSNHDEFEKNKWNIDWIKDFDLSEQEKQYQQYKKSDEYQEGKKLEDSDKEDIDDRELVIYDRYDPETALIYSFQGKRGKGTDHYVNMCRMDFKYEMGVKYYDCYSCLAKYYFSHTPEELKREPQLDIDPEEFK